MFTCSLVALFSLSCGVCSYRQATAGQCPSHWAWGFRPISSPALVVPLWGFGCLPLSARKGIVDCIVDMSPSSCSRLHPLFLSSYRTCTRHRPRWTLIPLPNSSLSLIVHSPLSFAVKHSIPAPSAHNETENQILHIKAEPYIRILSDILSRPLSDRIGPTGCRSSPLKNGHRDTVSGQRILVEEQQALYSIALGPKDVAT